MNLYIHKNFLFRKLKYIFLSILIALALFIHDKAFSLDLSLAPIITPESNYKILLATSLNVANRLCQERLAEISNPDFACIYMRQGQSIKINSVTEKTYDLTANINSYGVYLLVQSSPFGTPDDCLDICTGKDFVNQQLYEPFIGIFGTTAAPIQPTDAIPFVHHYSTFPYDRQIIPNLVNSFDTGQLNIYDCSSIDAVDLLNSFESNDLSKQAIHADYSSIIQGLTDAVLNASLLRYYALATHNATVNFSPAYLNIANTTNPVFSRCQFNTKLVDVIYNSSGSGRVIPDVTNIQLPGDAQNGYTDSFGQYYSVERSDLGLAIRNYMYVGCAQVEGCISNFDSLPDDPSDPPDDPSDPPDDPSDPPDDPSDPPDDPSDPPDDPSDPPDDPQDPEDPVDCTVTPDDPSCPAGETPFCEENPEADICDSKNDIEEFCNTHPNALICEEVTDSYTPTDKGSFGTEGQDELALVEDEYNELITLIKNQVNNKFNISSLSALSQLPEFTRVIKGQTVAFGWRKWSAELQYISTVIIFLSWLIAAKIVLTRSS